MSFADLNRHADALAGHLAASGVGPGSRVGVVVERSPSLLVALLGVLKTGAAYVPVDPDTPADRMAFVFTDADVDATVTSSRLASRLPQPGPNVTCVDAFEPGLGRPSHPSDSQDLAYVIYTSGTSGRPKGVAVEHGSVLRLLDAMRDRLGVTSSDRVLGVTTPAFDLSVPDLFLPLTTGASLRLATEAEAADPDRLGDLLARATLMQATPATWRMLVDAGWTGNPSLTIVTGGDALAPDLADALYERAASVWNFYGPTEATVWATCGRVLPGRPVTLGSPLPGASVTLHAPDGAEVRPGETGEIYVGGWGVARGYLGRPDLTNERFVTDPTTGERRYRTGDLATRAADGALHFRGRADTQVKIRGHRVELGEVEAVLAEHPAVAECAVALREDRPGDVRLVAYVVTARGSEPSADALGRYLGARLPRYMVPGRYVTLDALPLTDRLKLDRAALPALPDPEAEGREGAPPRTVTERRLAALWAEVLGVSAVGRDDSFEALGGHSLLAVRLVARVRDEADVALSLADVFRHPTLRTLAAEVDRRRGEGTRMPERTDRREGPLSFAQQGLWFLDRLRPGSPRYTIAEAFRLRGALDLGALQTALSGLAGRHETLRTRLVEDRDGTPVQTVDEGVRVPLRVIEADERTLGDVLTEAARRPFRLGEDLPFRAMAVRLGADEHALLLTLHHTAADGWSLPVLHGDLVALYAAALDGTAPVWASEPPRYLDVARWQRGRPETEREADRRFWRRTLRGLPPVLALPTEAPRGPDLSDRGTRTSVVYPAGLGDALDALCRREGVTPFVASLTAYAALLAHLGDEDDVVIGVNTSGRERAGAEAAVGLYVNLVPVRVAVDPRQPWRGALAGVRDRALSAFRHGALPFDSIVEAVRPERHPGVSPLVQTVFTLADARDDTLGLPGVEVTPLHLDLGTATFDLVFDLVRDGADLSGVLEHRTDLYGQGWARSLLTQYGVALSTLVEHPDQPISDLGRALDHAREGVAQARTQKRRQALGALRRPPRRSH